MALSHFETPDGYLVIGTHDPEEAIEYLRTWRAQAIRNQQGGAPLPKEIPEYITPRRVNPGYGKKLKALEFTR